MKRTTAWAATVASLLGIAIGCKTGPAPRPSVLTPLPTTMHAIDSMGPTNSVVMPSYLKASTFDFVKLYGNPPKDDSEEHVKETKLLLMLQEIRTPADEARCRSEVGMTAFWFQNVIGPWFVEKDLPITAALLHDAGQQAKQVTGMGKRKWKRVRPPLADSRIHPCVPLETTYSYPSGHATIGAFWATILAEMFPADRDIILARGQQIGFDRLIAGMHWPTDVIAGAKLGQEIAHRMLADPQFRARLDKAKAECLAVMSH